MENVLDSNFKPTMTSDIEHIVFSITKEDNGDTQTQDCEAEACCQEDEDSS